MNELFTRYASWGFPQKPIHIPTVIRINTLKTTVEQTLEELKKIGVKCTQTPLPYAFEVNASFAIASSLPYLQGDIHIQELVSQVPVFVADPKPNQLVLDVASSPGNKATQASAHMNNTGVVVALDNNAARLQKVTSNVSRLGVTNLVQYTMDASYADEVTQNADVVFCDVPCSGNYTQDRWHRTLEDIRSRVPLQQQLLEASVYAAKVGATIVYSTCSLEIEENEEVIEWALKELPVELVPIELDFGHPGLTETTNQCKRFWPTQDHVGGFFVAKLVRKE